MVSEIDLVLTDDVRAALSRFGRTEDVTFSPDNRRVAIAGFHRHRIFVLDVEVGGSGCEPPSLSVTGLTEVGSPLLAEPHGVAFLDDHTIVVANRGGLAPVLHLPAPSPGVRRVHLSPVQVIGLDEAEDVATPGSVRVVESATGLVDVLVCNNYSHRVTRHLFDTVTSRVLTGETLVTDRLDIPDGVAVSNDGRWLAISNHNTSSVLLFENGPDLGPGTSPVGELCNVAYPHGLQFTPDDRHVLVADAGSPYVHVFTCGASTWDGARDPVASVRVMDDETYLMGRENPQEGGPKGLAVDRTGRLVALTNEHLPLSVFPLSAFVGADQGPTTSDLAADRDRIRGLVLRELGRSQRHRARAEEVTAELDQREIEAAALRRERDEREAATSMLHGEVQQLRLTVGEQEVVVQQLRAHVTASDQALEALHESLVTCAAELEAVAAARAAELVEASATIGYLEAVIADRELQLEGMRQSRSWRVTAPLRSVRWWRRQ